MKNGLAIWHYPHRTLLENVAYFAECGFDSVSILGDHMYDVYASEEIAQKLAELIKKNNLTLTVHHRLPVEHSDENTASFKFFIDSIADFQDKYGCVSILSFDVWQPIRDNMTPYIDYVMEKVKKIKIAVEDFGLNDAEKAQIEHLKGNDRFGYLIDIGHMYIRMCSKNTTGLTLFSNSPQECPANDNPSCEEFLRALKSKEFPIFEVHLHNNNGIEDQHLFLEDGTLKIDAVTKALKEIGFDGVLTIESAPGMSFKCENEESDMRINKTFDYLKELLK